MSVEEQRGARPPRQGDDRGGRFGDRPGGDDRGGRFGDRAGGDDRVGRRFGGGGGGRFFPRRKVCQFCIDNIDRVDYKDVPRLRRMVSDRAKIEPRRKTGTCARHQRSVTLAIKRARHMALLPFTSAHGRP